MQPPVEQGQVASELLAYVKRLERNFYGWRAIHLHLSQLRPHNRRDFQLRIAASEFDSLLRRFSSELFQLINGDIFFLWHCDSTADVEQVLLRLRYLFSDDPLIKAGGDDVNPAVEPDFDAVRGGVARQPRFCTWFELECEYDTFCLRVGNCVAAPSSAAPDAKRAPTLDLTQLASIETRLATMNLSGLILRQPICAVLPGTSPRALFTEVHIAIGKLAGVLGVDLTADIWLFQHLAESLDRRLMSSLIQGIKEPQGPISVNLRLATLLSPEFLKFDQLYRERCSSPVVIELQLIDIFAELGGFLFVREFLRDRGYLVCIDGLHYLHLPLIDRKRVGADMIKIIWSPDLLDTINEAQLAEFRVAIKRTGVDRVVLCRCDTADAIGWGQAVGIRLFQGHYVDSRLRSARPPAIAAARDALRSTTA